MTGFDVAREAGVTQPTVSRAIRNLPGVSLETRERVLAAAAKLGYVPSDSGRAMSTRVTRRVAVVTPALDNPYYPQLLEPLRRHLATVGLRTALVTAADHDRATEAALADELADGSYDGVILTSTHRRSALPRDLTERRIPHVLANRTLDLPESPACAVDNEAGGVLLADLLTHLGHTRIAMLSGPTATSTGKERADAVRSALKRQGVRLRREDVAQCSFDHEAGLREATRLLARPQPPTALVCGNDAIAIGALSAARAHGLRVPEDLTVVGFDDVAMAAWPLIELTTVRGDFDELSRLTIELLREVIARPDAAVRVERVTPTLVPRATHGPPNTRA